MLNSNVGYCHRHRRWTLVDTNSSHFVCGELVVWDVPRGGYISVEQLEAEMPRMASHSSADIRTYRLRRKVA
jgi:hypothetical protein